MKSKTRGAIALITMVVLGAVVTIIVTSTIILGVSSRQNALHLNQSSVVFIKADGCLEEALLRLNRDDAYGGDTYEIGDMECEISVSGSEDERTITIEAVEEAFYHHFSVEVQIDPSFGILSFSY